MQKQAPSVGRILAMTLFALSCFGILLFLWLAFGGAVPLKAQGYRLKVPFPEAATLATEADVRMSGVTIGKVKTKALDKGAARTMVELEIGNEFAPIAKDSRAILRQKTLLGETYVEVTPGHKAAGNLKDNGTLERANVEPTVELDEIFNAFDKPTREAFRQWVAESAKAIRGGRGQDLNDALGNLAGFATDGASVLRMLDEQERAVKGLVKNTGVVFGALNERQGALRQLIVNSNNTFEATASRDEALAETFRIFPTFLDESRLTLARLERFANNTNPLVRDLKGPADDLGPTVRDLGGLAPYLEKLFRDLDPLIKTARTNLPALERFLRGAGPLFKALHPFLQELNPILSYVNFQQKILAGFIMVGSAGLNRPNPADPAGETRGPFYYLGQWGNINGRSLSLNQERPSYERANAYKAPNAYSRAKPLGAIESFSCTPAGGEQRNAFEDSSPQNADAAPCFVAPPSLFDNLKFPNILKGKAPVLKPPQDFEGNSPATP